MRFASSIQLNYIMFFADKHGIEYRRSQRIIRGIFVALRSCAKPKTNQVRADNAGNGCSIAPEISEAGAQSMQDVWMEVAN